MKLRDYQRACVLELLIRERVYLVSDMGSGKTAIGLQAMLSAPGNNKGFLIIAPKLVATSVWMVEAKLWVPFSTFKILNLACEPGQRVKRLSTPAHAYVINYELLPWLAKNCSMKTRFSGLILDEITRLKAPNKARWKALLPLADNARYVWGFTGTPLSTSLLDLFGQFRMIDHGKALGRFITHYKQRYFFQTTPQGWTWEPRPGAKEEIFKAIKPVSLIIPPGDQLKEIKTATNEIFVELERPTRRAYKQLLTEFVLELPEDTRVIAENAAVLTGKLTQFTGGGLYGPDSDWLLLNLTKLDALSELLENLKGSPTLLVYAYRGEAEYIRDHACEETGVSWLGNDNTYSDEQLIERWNAGKIPCLLIHPASAGHGLNLQQGGHHIIWYGGTWSQEMYRQTNARIARSGQTSPVYIHHLLVRDTIDTVQYKVMQGRMRLQDDLLTAIIES